MTTNTRWDKPDRPWVLPAGAAVLSRSAGREAWLEARRDLIGASDVAKVLNASSYGDAFSVWLDKTGRAPQETQTKAQARGLILEDGVVELWATHYYEEPIELRRQGLVRSRRYPHAGATVDRLSICPLGRCLVEVKTQADMSEWTTLGEDEVPTDYQLQGQWQLGVTGRDHIHFVALGPRFQPVDRIMYRDEELIETLLQSVAGEWWDTFVAADTPPSPTDKSLDLIKWIYGNPNKGSLYVLAEDEEAAELFRALPILKGDLDAAEHNYRTALAQLQARIGNATEVVWEPDDRKPVATWRPGKTIDGCTGDFVAANRELVEPFTWIDSVEKVNVDKLVENHPELLTDGRLRRRRTWSVK